MNPLLAAGAGFAGTVVLGFLAGVVAAQRTGQSLWVLGGLLAGLAGAVIVVAIALRDEIRFQK